MDDKPNQPAATPSTSDSASDNTRNPATVDDNATPAVATPSMKDRFASMFNRSTKKDDTEGNDKPKPVPFLQLFKYSEPAEKLLLLFSVVNAVIHGFLLPGFVILFGTIVNSFGSNTDQSQILDEVGGIAKWFLVLGGVAFVTGLFQVRFSLIFAQQVANRIRNLYFKSLMRQDMTWYDSVETGELTARVSGDVNLLEAGIGSKIAAAVQFVTSFFVGFVVAFVYSWKLTFVVLSVAPFIMIGGALFARLSASGASETLDSYASAGAIASEALSLVRTVTAFNGQETEAERYEEKLQTAYVATVKKAAFSGISVGFTYFVIFVAFAVAFIYGGYLVRQGEVEGGDVLITFFAVFIATISLGQAAPSFTSISNARGAAPKVYAVIERVSEIDPSNETEGLQPESFKGDIRFSSVKFNYPTHQVDDDGEARPYILNDFNLHVKSGSSHALVGPSGCGKSTTVRLIERFYDVSDGSLLLDGVDVREYNVRWLRSQIGYVGQMPTLFMLSVRDNIAMGAADMDKVEDDDIINAAKMANAHDFIMQLPQQYDTMLLERGASLSGGQKQRICIARALVRNPRILLLDESTSALDSQSERHVQEALEKAAQGRTTITIAHRLSTVKNADTISVIDAGHVKEEGTHAELINWGGVYNTLVENQKIAASKTEQESGGAGAALNDGAPASLAESLTKGKSSTTKNAEEGGDEEDEEEETAVEKGIVGRAFAYNRAEIPFVILGLIGAAMAGAAFPLSAVAFGDVLQDIFLEDNQEAVRRAAIFFVLIGCLAFFGHVFNFAMLGISGGRLTRKLRGAMFRGLLKQEIGFFDKKKNSVGQLTTRLATEATQVQGLTGDTLGAMTTVISTLTTGILVAYLSCWRIALVITGLVPAVAFSEYAQVKLISGFDADSASKFAAAGAVANEAVDSLTTVTSLGAQGYFIGRYLEELKKPLANGRRTSWISGVNFGFAELIVQTMWAIAFWVGAIFVRAGYCSFNELMKGVSGLLFAGSTLGQSAQFMPDFPKSQVAATKIFRFLDRVPKINMSGSVFRARSDMSGNVKAEGVHFEYPTRPNVKVLRGLSLSALKGQSIALVGASGCGKSTIIALMERFYDPRAGGVMVDDLDSQEYNLSNLRSHLGLVSQEPDLFNRSIRDNIAYGLLGDDNETMVVTDTMIETAAKQANCHDFIMRQPNKYDTIVGPRGERLSGGQRQRVAIARTLIRQPTVLLLDEATSALDSVAEQEVQKALQMAAKNRTTIAIAHRLSTVKDADTICVIEKGRVVESGKHDYLMAKNRKYAELVRNQVDQVER